MEWKKYYNLSFLIYYSIKSLRAQCQEIIIHACPGPIVGSVPEYFNKVHISVKWVTESFWFPGAYVMFTLFCRLLSVQ